MKITKISKNDFERFWPSFRQILQEQTTYALDPNMSMEEAYQLWCIQPQQTFVATVADEIVATYYIKPNFYGPASHICNCGYMVAPKYRNQGIATQLCKDSQHRAKELGFTAMQFNSVVSSNTTAVNLWKKLGYEILGTIPDAYNHKSLGFVDAYIMYKKLS